MFDWGCIRVPVLILKAGLLFLKVRARPGGSFVFRHQQPLLLELRCLCLEAVYCCQANEAVAAKRPTNCIRLRPWGLINLSFDKRGRRALLTFICLALTLLMLSGEQTSFVQPEVAFSGIPAQFYGTLELLGSWCWADFVLKAPVFDLSAQKFDSENSHRRTTSGSLNNFLICFL